MTTRLVSLIGVSLTITAGAGLGLIMASELGVQATVVLFLVLAIGAASARRLIVRRG